MAKKQKPQGIYANRYDSTHECVVTKIKVDRFRALAWLTEQTDPECFLEVLKSSEPDQYGNYHYLVIDEYTTNRKRQQAPAGIANAKQAAQQTPQSQEIPSAQFNNPAKVHADGVQHVGSVLETSTATEQFDDDIPF